MSQRPTVRGLHARWPPGEPKTLRAVQPEQTTAELPRWVTLSGLELGADKPDFCNEAPGKLGEDFFIHRRPSFERVAEEGYAGVRIPFCWERLQPRLGGPLDPGGIQDLRYMISAADRLDRKVLLAMHNAGRYRIPVDGAPVACGLDEQVGGSVRVYAEHFVEFWSRMSHALCGLPNLQGYSLMSAASGLPPGTWQMIAQSVIDIIREDRNDIPIYVAGNHLARASTWIQDNPETPWIEDPQGQIVYETRCALDHDESGRYEHSYAEERGRDPDIADRCRSRLQPFLDWLAGTGASGFVTDFSLPRDEDGWSLMLPKVLEAMQRSNVVSLCWSAEAHRFDDRPTTTKTRASDQQRPKHIGLFRGGSRPA